MPVDYGILSQFKSVGDYDIERQQRDLQNQVVRAQIKKASQLDVDALGEQAFLKAAMGTPLSPQEMAAAQFVDAKSGGQSFNPVTGEIVQRPRISEKIGLGNALATATVSQPAPKQSGVVKPEFQKYLQGGATESAPAPANSPDYLTTIKNSALSPKSNQKLAETGIESGRKRLDEIVAAAGSAGGAAQAASIMQELQPRIGYTGAGGGALASIDKLATGVGVSNLIGGDVADRETFQAQGVQAWVKAVEPLKGALTEREGARIAAAVPSLSTSPEGIQKITELTKILSERASEKASFYEQWFNQNATLDGADAVWKDYAEKNPLITADFLKVKKSSPVEQRRQDFNKLKQRLKYNPATGDFE